jgi:hypothetical protein
MPELRYRHCSAFEKGIGLDVFTEFYYLSFKYLTLMMRGLYITSLVISVVFFIVTCYYIQEVHSARMSALYESLNSYSDDPYSSFSSYDRDNEITQEGGFVGLGFFLFYAVLQILTFAKLKTKTMKVLTIIGISFTGIMILWDALMISSPGGISLDEVGPAWLLYIVIMISFGIVGTIHAFRKKA